MAKRLATIKVCVPAKINLTLDVIGRRPDGYHEIASLMQAVGLYDSVLLSRLESDPAITVPVSVAVAGGSGGVDVAAVPAGEGNLAVRALRVVELHCGRRLPVSIMIEKAIPVAAGLGGGSADAAAVLWGLNRLFGLGLSFEELVGLAGGIGSDVPFFLFGGTALATGRGERLAPVPCRGREWSVTLVKPDRAVSTAEVYAGLDLAGLSSPDTATMLTALRAGDFASACRNLGNVLESVTLARHPEVRRLRDRLRAAEAAGVLMSGSGPTVFAFTRSRAEAERVAAAVAGEAAFVAVAEFDGMGVRECPLA